MDTSKMVPFSVMARDPAAPPPGHHLSVSQEGLRGQLLGPAVCVGWGWGGILGRASGTKALAAARWAHDLLYCPAGTAAGSWAGRGEGLGAGQWRWAVSSPPTPWLTPTWP